MENIARLIRQYIAHKITLAQFLHRIEREKQSNWDSIRAWWRSPASFEACWNDLGGFDEREYEKRVSDAFYLAYSAEIRKALAPVVRRRISATPEMGMVLKKVEPFLFSDVRERVRVAQTVEEVYFLIGDDLTHWLVVYLVDYLAPVSNPNRT